MSWHVWNSSNTTKAVNLFPFVVVSGRRCRFLTTHRLPYLCIPFSSLSWQEAWVWSPCDKWVCAWFPRGCQDQKVYSKCLTTHVSLAFLNLFCLFISCWVSNCHSFHFIKRSNETMFVHWISHRTSWWGVFWRQIVRVSLSTVLVPVHNLSACPPPRGVQLLPYLSTYNFSFFANPFFVLHCCSSLSCISH